MAGPKKSSAARPRPTAVPKIQAALTASKGVGRDPNYQCRIDIYDELRAKCAADTASCKATGPDGLPMSYTDCERLGATEADLLRNFPVGKENNKRLQLLLRAGRDSGDPAKKDWDLSAAKRCLTQMWYGTEDGRTRLEACPPPKRSSRAKPRSLRAPATKPTSKKTKPSPKRKSRSRKSKSLFGL